MSITVPHVIHPGAISLPSASALTPFPPLFPSWWNCKARSASLIGTSIKSQTVRIRHVTRDILDIKFINSCILTITGSVYRPLTDQLKLSIATVFSG